MSNVADAQPGSLVSPPARRLRLHRSTVVLCIVWVMLSATLLWRGDFIDQQSAVDSGPAGSFSSSWENWEHGWPRTYLKRNVNPPPGGAWSIFSGGHLWDTLAFEYDLLVLAAMGFCGALVWEVMARRGINLVRFKLRTLLVATALCGLALTWWRYEAAVDRREAAMAEAMRKAGNYCDVTYTGPMLLRRLFGADNLPGHRITLISFVQQPDSAITKDFLKRARSLGSLRSISIGRRNAPIDQIASLVADLDRVEDIYIEGATDEAVRRLATMKSLKEIYLKGGPATDDSLQYLARCQKLETLNLDYTQVTDKGLAYLPSYPRLRDLGVYSRGITDSGVAPIKGCGSLERLSVRSPKVTDEGLAWLKSSRPQMRINDGWDRSE